jgi:CDP-diacylglycerol--serine O-phosphatidyltransferase
MLDGRVARLSGTGTRFGAELDSLVDLTSFGVAPALVMYFLEFSTVGRFGWVLCFLYVVAAAIRLARFNVASQTKPVSGGGWFRGLPSPSAGMTLAVYYPFTQTDVYHESLRYLQLNQETVKQLLRAGTIPGLKLGRAWRISRMQLDAMFAGGKPAEATPVKPKGVIGTTMKKP